MVQRIGSGEPQGAVCLYERLILALRGVRLTVSSHLRKNAVRQGYETYPHTRGYDELERTVRRCLNAMTTYAGVLAAQEKERAVQDLRNMARYMQSFWQDPLYAFYEKAGARMERQYTEKFDRAVASARESGQPPAFGAEKARAILRGLSVHAEEEAVGNGDLYSVWWCSRLAKQLWDVFPSIKTAFHGGFTIDTSDRYTKFGSTDSGHLSTERLLGQEVLVFNSPVPEDAVPEGWHCYHLEGQDIVRVDQLLSVVPAEGYVGTVLSPCALLSEGEQSRRIDRSLSVYYGETPLSEYCERNHLPEPDMSGIFPEQQAETMEMGGMSCG